MKGSSLLAPIAKRLQGKVAIITGGASGIGESTARLFAKHGASVIIADIQDELGHSVCSETGADGCISYVHCDVSNETDVENVVNTTVSRHGKLDIMFSNAGIGGEPEPGILNVNYDNFKSVLDTNVFGSIAAAKHASRVMIPRGKGSIIFTSSLCSLTAGLVSHSYIASKYAIVGLTKNLCVELGKYGIRVNCISPFGVVSSSFIKNFKGLDKKILEKMVREAANLKGEVVGADDVAEAALYLGSDESKYVSGLNLPVDGGYSITNVAVEETFSKYV